MNLKIFCIFCLVVLLTFKVESKSIENDEMLCESENCKSYADLVKSNLDETVDPCDDFYQFSCGNYKRTHEIKDDEYQTGVYYSKFKENKNKLSELLNKPISDSDNKWVKNAKTFYKSCIDLDSIEKNTEDYMLNLINRILGGWPLANGLENQKSAIEVMKLIYRHGGAQTSFLRIGVDVNPKNPKAHIIKVSQPNSITYDFFITDEYKKAYKSYYKKIVEIISQRTDLENVDKEIDDMYSLSKSLKKVQIKLADQLDAQNNNIELKISALEKQFPGFPWFKFITEAIFADIDGVEIDEDEPVSIDDWDYFVEMHKIFEDYSKNNKSTLQNFVIANLFSSFSDFLPDKYLKANLIIKRAVLGVTSLPPRNLNCVEKAQSLLPDETGYLYASTYLSKESKDDVKKMTDNILTEMLDIIQNSNWMDTASKVKALQKADYINKQVGYPDSFDKSDYIESHNNYILDPENYLKNSLITQNYSEREDIGKLRKEVDDTKWFVSASIMNAFYKPENNHIYIIAGILTQPFYDFALPKYINYGTIGFVIGHEITHAFDNLGRKYDKDGKFFNDNEEGLWTQKTIDKFKERSKCMIDQYSKFFVKQANMTLDGKQTLLENIADNGGAKASFRAYEKWNEKNLEPEAKLPGLEKYSEDQMFFIGLSQPWCSLIKKEALIQRIQTDPHSVNDFRVIGVSTNSQYFQRAFGCDDRNKTAVNQCEVW